MSQAGVGGIVAAMGYCHRLLQSIVDTGLPRNTTTYEVYQHDVDFFLNYTECRSAIRDTFMVLQVSCPSLGFLSSSGGFFCGDLRVIDLEGTILLNGSATANSSIEAEWVIQVEK
jgi:hypothetical protein